MNKLKILSVRDITFKEGCELYLDNCRERNLREGTIEHYKNSYKQLYKFFNPNMPISQINSDMYKKYVLYLRERISNDVSINAYLRDFITTMRFLMSEEYVPHFKLRAIKVDKPNVETYTEEELNCLLQKPNIKKCSFIEYQAWVMTSFLFSTGVRQRSLINILIKDIDFDNDIVHVNVTKNRKPLLVPINMTMSNILREFLKHRQHSASAFQNNISQTCAKVLNDSPNCNFILMNSFPRNPVASANIGSNVENLLRTEYLNALQSVQTSLGNAKCRVLDMHAVGDYYLGIGKYTAKTYNKKYFEISGSNMNHLDKFVRGGYNIKRYIWL